MTITKSAALRTVEEPLSAQALIARRGGAGRYRCRLHVRGAGICVCVEMHKICDPKDRGVLGAHRGVCRRDRDTRAAE